jgi:hypothetical protein
MRRTLAVLVLSGALAMSIGTPRVQASPYTAYFDTVRAKVVELRDAIPEPASGADAKRKALLEKVLTAIDAVSASLGQDLATAKKVALAVAKPLLDDPDLPGLAADLLRALAGEIGAHADELAARIAALPDIPQRAKAEAALAKARTLIDAAGAAGGAAELKAAGAALLKADKAALKAEKSVVVAESAALAFLPACEDVPDDGAKIVVRAGKTVIGVIELSQSVVPKAGGRPGDRQADRRLRRRRAAGVLPEVPRCRRELVVHVPRHAVVGARRRGRADARAAVPRRRAQAPQREREPGGERPRAGLRGVRALARRR